MNLSFEWILFTADDHVTGHVPGFVGSQNSFLHYE